MRALSFQTVRFVECALGGFVLQGQMLLCFDAAPLCDYDQA